MDRADPAGMSGVPCLEQRQGLAAADLADDDAIRPAAHRRFQQLLHGDGAGRPERQDVLGGALQLRRVLDDDQAVFRCHLRHVGEDRVAQCRLARGSAADDKDVLALSHGPLDHGLLPWRHHLLLDVIGEREHRRGAQADGELRCRHDGRYGRREPRAEKRSIQRQLAFQDRAVARDRGAKRGRHRADEAFRRAGGHGADRAHTGAVAILPESAIRVEDQLEHARFGEDVAADRTELAAQRFRQTPGLLIPRGQPAFAHRTRCQSSNARRAAFYSILEHGVEAGCKRIWKGNELYRKRLFSDTGLCLFRQRRQWLIGGFKRL